MNHNRNLTESLSLMHERVVASSKKRRSEFLKEKIGSTDTHTESKEILEHISLPTVSCGRYYIPLYEKGLVVANDVSDVHSVIGRPHDSLEGGRHFNTTGGLYRGGYDPIYFSKDIPTDGSMLYPLILRGAESSAHKIILEMAIPQTETLIMKLGAKRYDSKSSTYPEDKTRPGWQYTMCFPTRVLEQQSDLLPLTQISQSLEPTNLMGHTIADTEKITFDTDLVDHPLGKFFPNKSSLMLIPLIISMNKLTHQRVGGIGLFYKGILVSPETSIHTRTAAIEVVCSVLGINASFAPEGLVNSYTHCIASTYRNPAGMNNIVRVDHNHQSIGQDVEAIAKYLDAIDLKTPTSQAMKELRRIYPTFKV